MLLITTIDALDTVNWGISSLLILLSVKVMSPVIVNCGIDRLVKCEEVTDKPFTMRSRAGRDTLVTLVKEI